MDGMKLLESIYEKARAKKTTIILADAEDERALLAAKIVEEFSLAELILIGNSAAILKMQRELDLTLNARIYDPTVDGAAYPAETRKSRAMLAATLVKEGLADGFIAGNICTSKETILAAKAALFTNDFASSHFIIIHKNVPLLFTDCAYHIDPTAHDLAQIGISAAHAAEHLGIKPHLAFLSFSTAGSAEHAHVQKVVEAAKIAKKLVPQLKIDGEVQFDAAFDPTIADKKIVCDSARESMPNIFVFPDLNSGNIGYKIATHIGGCVAIGPILTGFSHPVSDLSRGCKMEDIVNAVAVVASQVKR